MESKFIPTLQVGNGYTYLKLQGVLDEDNLLANLLSQIQGRLLLIDMAEVERINSCGVRDWVNWLNQIQALGIAVILLRCSPAVVSQANMVANFAADSFIHSFFAPYVHPDTGEEQSVLLFTEDLRQNLPIRAPKIFNESGEELEFDEFEESYFAFITDPRILNYRIAPDVQAVIQYYLPEAATRQPVIGGAGTVQQPSQSASKPVQDMSRQAAYQSMPASQGMPSSGYGALPYGAGAARPQQGGPGGQGRVPQPPMPQPSSMVRHEQPPLPSGEGAQRAPMRGMPVSQGMPSQAVQPSQPQGLPMNREPRPAPAPVSALAAQAMARQSNAVSQQAGLPQPGVQQSGFGLQSSIDGMGRGGFGMADSRKQMYLKIGIGIAVGLFVILLVILLSKLV